MVMRIDTFIIKVTIVLLDLLAFLKLLVSRILVFDAHMKWVVEAQMWHSVLNGFDARAFNQTTVAVQSTI